MQARLRGAGTLGSGRSARSAASLGLDKPPCLSGPVSMSERMGGGIGPDDLEDPLAMNVLSDQSPGQVRGGLICQQGEGRDTDLAKGQQDLSQNLC